MMKRVCIFTLYGEKGASSRYRILMYIDKLKERFHVNCYRFWSDEYITKYTYNKKKYCLLIGLEYVWNIVKRLYQLFILAPKCDVIFIQKGAIPGFKSTFLHHLLKKDIKLIYDVDDAIYLNHKNNTDEIAKLADVIICGNTTLLNHYSQINSNCVVLPTVEDTRKFKPFWGETFNEKIIGWIGSGVTLHNLDLVVDALNIIAEKHPEVKFHIICNTAGEYLKGIKNAVFIKWELETYIKELGRFTIGIMPLKDLAINKGKCGFKLIQCLNMRKPVIATDLGVNREIIGRCGLLAATKDEWVEAMEQLLFDREKYNECVRQIDFSFFPQYDFDLIANKLIDLFY